MRIVTPSEIEQVAWEGNLEPPAQMYRGVRSAAALAPVTVGEPVWWAPEEALESQTGKKWMPPAGDRQYTLLRLACSLHPPAEGRARYNEATLSAYLRPRQGIELVIAHDLFPQRLTAEDKGKFTFGLGPDLKFGALAASLLEVGAEIEYHKVFPVIQGYGLGESRPYWKFAHHATKPLLGCQSVYVVLAAPKDARGVRLSVELIATLETRWGPITVGLPEEVRDHLSWTIG